MPFHIQKVHVGVLIRFVSLREMFRNCFIGYCGFRDNANWVQNWDVHPVQTPCDNVRPVKKKRFESFKLVCVCIVIIQNV